ncbi:MAG: TonB-dependent siderophore receptor [Nostoc sp.]|uniref:TonB-dependent siderophore receptor n=1 Tax=Nostoc sp. TaxID=1180 RepID=UPI002FF837B8
MKSRRQSGISLVGFAFTLIAILTQSATGSEVSKPNLLSDKHDFVKNVAPLLVQQPVNQVVKVTGVKLNNTSTGIELVLQTSLGEALKPVAKSEGNSFIADIPNVVLELPDGQEFRSLNPAKGIVSVSVTALDASSIRVTVTGEASSPKVALFDDPEGLVFGFTPAPSSQAQTQPTPPQQPSSETQPEQPSDQDDQPIELVVTGEQDGYRASEASTATKTDTPLRDIPASVDVVPRQLIQDRQVTRVQQATDTVAGVQPAQSYGGLSSAYFFIRGFAASTTYRDGFRDFGFLSPIDVANIDRLEILKGPASVLYGQNDPGGIVNIVSKRPLQQPRYEASFTAGSYNFYRSTLDFSSPLNFEKTAAYRLNIAYENAGSFRDFNDSESIFVAPAFSWEISKNTKITFLFEYQNYQYGFDRAFLPEREFFQIPISRFLGEPDFNNATANSGRASYILEHQFSDNWKLRHAFAAVLSSNDPKTTYPDGLQDDRRTLNRSASRSEESSSNYTIQNELLGKFNTGSVKHSVLFGSELFRQRFKYQFFSGSIDSINIFNPVYGAKPGELIPDNGDEYGNDGLSLYFQDQITLLKNLKLLAGGRFDLVRSIDENFLGERFVDKTETAFTPRVGIVYQPIEPISLYLSYSKSFNPVIFGTSRTGARFQPEKGEQLEVGLKADLIPDKLSATLAFYDLVKQNVLIADPDDSRFSIQTGEQKSRGVEFSLTGSPVKGWNIAVGYAYTDAFVSKDITIPIGDQLAGVPANQFGLWTSYEIQAGSLTGLGFGLGLFYVDDRKASLPNTDVELASYLRADASVFYRRNNWKVQVNINNLGNTQYYNSYGGFLVVPQPPLNVLGSISVEF